MAVMLTCAAVGVVLAFLGASAVHPASSGTARLPGVALNAEQARKPSRMPHSMVAPRRRLVRKERPSSPLAAVKRTTYGIVFFGDSVSVGFGATIRDRGYVVRVSKWLRRHGKRVVATVNAKGGVPVGYWQYTPVPEKLRAAIVELGTNDVRLGTPPAQFSQQYRTLTSRIRASNPKAQLLCLSIWPRRAGASLERVVNAQIRAVCPGKYVDITRLRKRWGIRSSDGFHPNDAGYLLIARAVESRLRTS